jgi:ribosome-associated protein
MPSVGIEGENGSDWILIDFQDVLVHLMLPRVREFYNIEKLWSLHSIEKQSAIES